MASFLLLLGALGQLERRQAVNRLRVGDSVASRTKLLVGDELQ